MEYTQKASRPQAIIVAILFHAILLILFYLVFKLRVPNPPLRTTGGSGIELNYGLDEAGFGDVETMKPASEAQNQETASTDASSTEESNPEKQPDDQSTVITGNDDNIPVKQNQSSTSTAKTTKTPDNTSKQSQATTQNNSNTKANSANNNGNQQGSTGNQGSKTGSKDAKDLYGNEGNGGPGPGGVGGDLDIAGWMWDSSPDIQDKSDENGKVVIGFKIDESGNVQSVWKIESNLSPSVTKKYEDAVYNLTFSKKNDNIKLGGASGKVTFIKKSK
ncbi:MAG: hypothetical protein ACJ75J_10050 [Cytophagaceae bacterium]